MSSKLLTFLFYLFLMTNDFITGNSNIKVIGVVELMRHGARAPLITYNEKVKNLYFGTKRSQLTINGCRQHLLLGRWIRRRYVEGDVYKLIDKKIKPKQVTVISSPLQRTIFSAAAHVMGLYPDAILKYTFEGKSGFKNDDEPPIEGYKVDNRDGEEVNVNVVDNETDTMFRVHLCRRKGSKKILRQEFTNEVTFFKMEKEEIKKAIEDINKNYGKYFEKSHFDNNKFYQVRTLNIMLKFLRPYEYHSDLKLKLKHDTLKTITKAILNRLYGYRINETKVKKLLASHMLDVISHFFSLKVNKGFSRDSLIILSGHDSNIINVIVNLFGAEFLKEKILSAVKNVNDKNFLVPPLASSLLFELIQVTGSDKYWVRLVYNGENITEGFAMNVKKFGKYDLLDYDDFKNLLTSRIDLDYRSMNCSKTIE